jgi:UDP-2,3-diacylglucosamine hydrolase
MRAWFISDLHLRDINERNSILLLRFLRSLLKDSETTHLFLLGDIFDLWIGDSEVFQKKFQELVDVLVELKRKGVEIVYFEGNHDVHVKGFWENKLGIPVFVDAQIYQLKNFKVRLEHGDFINPNDTAYLKYRNFIRKPSLEKVAYLLPGRLLDEVGLFSSKLSRKKSSVRRRNNLESLRVMIRDYAQEKIKETDFDYIITGHMHVRDEFEFAVAGKKKISINLGSWFETPKALCLTEKGTSWVDLVPSSHL